MSGISYTKPGIMCKALFQRNIFNFWYAPNFLRIAGENHITTVIKWWVHSHACNTAGGGDEIVGAITLFYNRGE